MHSQEHCPPAEPRRGARRTAAAPTILLACVAALASLPAHGAGSFRLSSCTSCAQSGPGAVAGNPQGAFMTAWTNATPSSPAVAARFFKPDGTPRGADIELGTGSALLPGDAAVAAEASGFFVAAWSRKDGSNSEVLVQRYRRTTAPLGVPLTVSLDEPGSIKLDFAPAVAFLADGTFLVAWQRFGPPIGTAAKTPVEVMTRRFSFRTGRAFGPPSKVSDGLVDVAEHVALCATRTGAVAAAWTSLDRIVPFLPSLHGAVFRRLTPGGQPFGSETPLAAPTSMIGGVALACSATSFTAAWRTDQIPGGPGIVVRRVATNGAMGTTLPVSEDAVAVSAPSAFEDARGNTVVTWIAEGDNFASLLARRIEAGGALGSGFVAATLENSSTSLRGPSVSAIGRAGDFVLVWTSDDALYGQRFSASGATLRAHTLAAEVDPPAADER